MKKFLKTLLLTLMAAMILSLAFVGAAADGTDAEYPAAVPITYDGMSARVKTDAPGLRSIYRVDLTAVKAWEDAGYTVEYGAIMAGEKKKFDDEVSSTPDQLRVVKNAETGEYTAYVDGGAQKAQPVCVYSSTGASYASGIFTYKNETEAGFAFTGVFRYEQQNSVYYNFGFIYAGFFYAEKQGEEPIIEYIVPEVADGEFFADNKCTLFEVSTYWAEQPGSYAKNKNILNVIRSQQETVYTETYSAEEPLSLAANATHEMTLSNMKEGIYAVKVKATGSTSSYGRIYYSNGGIGRQYMKRLADGTEAWQYIYLNEGSNTVKIVPEGAITVESIEISLAEEILPENMASYFSLRESKNDETFEDRVTAGAEYVSNANGTGAYFYDGDAGRSITVKFDGVKAGKYRVYAIGHTGSASTQIAVTVSEIESTPKTYNRTGDGSTGAGGNYIDFGTYEFAEGTNNVTIAATGSYVNIGTILLVREAHTVTIQNFDGKILSKQEVYDGEYAASTNVTSVPEGYELLDKVAFSSFPITEDTVIYPNARRAEPLSAAIDGTKMTVEGATEGYYNLDINVTADFSSGNYLWVEANGTVYGDRCLTYEEGHTETISMAVYLKGGTNTLTVKSHDDKTIKNIVVNSATFTNVQHTYDAVRVLSKEFTEDSTFQNTSENGIVHNKLALRTSDVAIYSSVTFPSSGYYFFYSAGRAEGGTVKLTVGETETVLSLGATAGNATNHTKFHSISNNCIYVEAGTYDVTLSEHAKVLLSMDALVFAPHLVCIPEAEYTVDVEPTCNKDGSKSYHCTVCGEIIEKTVVSILADNDLHVGDWELIEGTENGAAKVNCTVCGKTVVKEFLPTASGTVIDASQIAVDGTTVTVNAPVSGVYGVKVSGFSGYNTLYNNAFGSASATKTRPTVPYVVYLYENENTLTFSEAFGEGKTVESITLIASGEIGAYTHANTSSVSTTTPKELGTLSVKEGGYFRISAKMQSFNSASSVLILTNGTETITTEKPQIISGTDGSTGTVGYGVLSKPYYLAEGDWTVTIEVSNATSTSFVNISTVFAFPVETVDHVCSEFEDVETVAPTCSTEGVMTEVCVLCGEVNSERPIPATGEHIGEWSVTTEPTCDTEGVNSCICTVCGEVTSTEAIAAKGHSGEWVVTKEMTATEDGLMKQLCGECGKTTVKTMKNPYIIQIDNDDVTVREVSGNNVTVTTDVAGWYEIEILGNGGSESYYKLYNETLNDTNVYTYQKETNAGDDGFAIYLLADVDNVLNYNGTWTGVNVNLLAAHAYEDYATSGHKSLALATGTATYTITVNTDGYYILGGTSKLQDLGSYLHLDIVGEDVEVPLDHYFENPLTTAEGSNGSLGYDEFGMVYLTAGTYTVTATNPKAIKDNNTASNTHRVYIGSLFAYAVEMGEHIHSAETTSEITTPPTCNEAGERTYYCLDCGEAVSTEVIDATGEHTGEWIIVPPTLEGKGSATMTCSCGETLNKEIAPLYYTGESVTVGADAITVDGSTATVKVTVENDGFYYLTSDMTLSAKAYYTAKSNAFGYISKNRAPGGEPAADYGVTVYLKAGDVNTVTVTAEATVSSMTTATFTRVSEKMAASLLDSYKTANGGEAVVDHEELKLTVAEDGTYCLGGLVKLNGTGLSMKIEIYDEAGTTLVTTFDVTPETLISLLSADGRLSDGSSATSQYLALGAIALAKGTYSVKTTIKSPSGGNYVNYYGIVLTELAYLD